MNLLKIYPHRDVVYFMRKVFGTLVVPDEKYMNGHLKSFLASEVSDKIMLEFGGGTSSVYFSQICKSVVCVEADSAYIKAIKKNLKAKNLIHKIKFFNPKIGFVKAYSYPLKSSSFLFRNRFLNYSIGYFLNNNNESSGQNLPDAVFIDGRFRVACAAASLKFINKNFILIVDDYFSRVEYHVIEKIVGKPDHAFNDTVVFHVKKERVDSRIVELILNQYCLDPR